MASSVDPLPLISVVVPSYQQGHFLPDTLESIFRQDYPRLEVIVIDGGSTDGSVDVIRRYESQLKYWRSERDGGQSAAINEGMTHCSGDLIAWLNSDDYYWGDCLWTVGKAFARFPGRGLYVGNGLRFDQASGTYIPFNPRHVALHREALRQGADYILQPSTFFLRSAWQQVGGLDNRLRYCMDWDIFIRIADRYPCVVMNEFIGVSREYEETKTRSGKLERVFEIFNMIRRHTRQEVTVGGLLYLFDTLAGMSKAEGVTPQMAGRFLTLFQELYGEQCAWHGRGTWFPAQTDPQDDVYLPFARGADRQHPVGTSFHLPAVRAVVTGPAGDLLDQTLDSVRCQNYPAVETIVAGTDRAKLAEALGRPGGEVVVWLEAGDLLADGSMYAAAAEFAADPALDVVCGNALHLDEAGELFLADHGLHDSAFWPGSLPPRVVPPDFHFQLYQAPRSAVYFRQARWLQCGKPLPDTRSPIADQPFFRVLAAAERTKKLERTLGFCRTAAATYEADRLKLFADYYRAERPFWPKPGAPTYKRVLRRFVGNFTRWKFSYFANRKLYWVGACLAALSAITGVGNPMRWWPSRDVPLAVRRRRVKAAAAPANRAAA